VSWLHKSDEEIKNSRIPATVYELE
jgi:hypothetical protein